MKFSAKNSFSPLMTTLSLAISAAMFATATAAQERVLVEQRILEEVIVTAQKRAESSQDIPVAVTAINFETLENLGITKTQDLVKLTPSLSVGGRFANSKQNTSFSLRGVGTSAFSVGVEQSVAVVLDDVSTVQAGQALTNLIDIERIEVLRGPQSTLFGKSASAGLLNIVTKAPADEFEGTVELTATDDDEQRVQGSVSGPISNTMAYRLTGYWSDRDGYIDNLTDGDEVNDEDNKGLRGKFQWDINDNLDALLIGYWSEAESTCCALTWRELDPDARVFGFVPEDPAVGINPDDDNLDYRADNPPDDETDNSGGSLRFNLALGEFTLTSISAYDNWDYTDAGEVDNSDVDVQGALTGGLLSGGIYSESETETDYFSQEFRLVSPSYEHFDYLLGLFYADADTDREFLRIGIPLASNWTGNVGTESMAVFGQGTWRFSEATSVIVGLRWNDEEITADFNDLLIPDSDRISGDDSDSEVLGNVSLQHFFTDDIMVYARYAQGYKGQAFDMTATFSENKAENPVEPETSDAYEIGIKTKMWDQRLQLNATAFYTEYDDFQAESTRLNPDGSLTTNLNNVGELETKGVELEGVALIGNNLTVSFGAAYIDAVVKTFDDADCYPGQAFEGVGCVDKKQDISNGELPNSPDWKWNVAADYHLELDSMPFYGFVNLTYVWQDEVNFSLLQNPLAEHDSYGVGDFNFGINDKDDRYRVTAFVNNFTDESFSLTVLDYRDVYGGGTTRSLLGSNPRASQRYYGMRVRFNF
jgi:iron complex outermembrane receptor protein